MNNKETIKEIFVTQILPILIFPIGDMIVQVLFGEFSLERTLAILALAIVFYSWEIPKFFAFLNNFRFKTENKLFLNKEKGFNAFSKTLATTLFFNPLWITRHIFVIDIAVKHFMVENYLTALINSLNISVMSFIYNLPVAIIGNYIVQNKLPLKYRFLGCVILTCIFSILYALAYKFLG